MRPAFRFGPPAAARGADPRYTGPGDYHPIPGRDVQATASLRFYEELNDWLPPGRRKVRFNHPIEQDATVDSVLAALGVPSRAVDLILVNGESVGLDQALRDSDRVSFYPVFESLDIGRETRLPGRPLREPKFVLDVRLGRLTVYLRMLGFDSLYRDDWVDAELAAVAGDQDRILLTRDRKPLAERGVTRGYRLRSTEPRAQLLEVVKRLDLAGAAIPFRCCLRCNTPVEPVAATATRDRLLPATRAASRTLSRCPGCGRVYREGSHYRRMRRFVDHILATARSERASP